MTGYGPPGRNAVRPKHPSDGFERLPSQRKRSLNPVLVGLVVAALAVVVVVLLVWHVL